MKQPIQPLYEDEHGVLRFHPNKIVEWMLEAGRRGERFDMNTIACIPNIPIADQEQFAQLHGYSLSGFGDLSFVTDYTWEAAHKMHDEGVTEEQARIAILERQLDAVRTSMKALLPQLFHVHESDLEEYLVL